MFHLLCSVSPFPSSSPCLSLLPRRTCLPSLPSPSLPPPHPSPPLLNVEPETRQPSKWRMRREQEIYSTKLLNALHLVRAGGGRQEVHDVAYHALAVAAQGHSQWSRAILASRVHHALRVHVCSPTPTMPLPPPALARKVKVLGWLVPECWKLPFLALLSEATNYITALDMQVRAMSMMAQAFSSVSASSPAPV